MAEPDYKSYLEGKGLEYRGYYIRVKQDFGSGFALIDGLPCAWGYIVTDGLCDVSPAAAWYQTVADAKTAIDILIHVGGEKKSEHFWTVYRRFQARVRSLRREYTRLPAHASSRERTAADAARDHGAELHKDGMRWKVLDQPDTPLWWAVFDSEEDAARAYLAQHNIKWPA